MINMGCQRNESVGSLCRKIGTLQTIYWKSEVVMGKFRCLLLSALSACLFGCSPKTGVSKAGVDREALPDLTGARVEVRETGVTNKIDDLKADDVIVAVDGVPYTKKMFDDERMLLAEQLRRQGKSAQETMSTLGQMVELFPYQFVNRYLIILEAQRVGFPSPEEVQKAYTRNLEGLRKSRNMTLDQIERAYPSRNKDMMYRKIAEELYVKLYAATNIPPIRVVDSNFVNEVKETIRQSAAESAATNAVILAELKELAKKLAGNTNAFAVAANTKSVDPETPYGSGGNMGFMEREQIQNKEVAAAVFALKNVGDITNPIVEEDSAFIIQLLSITPPVTNETGRVVQGELRETARIFRELEGKPIQMSDTELWKELEGQMYSQGLDKKILELSTNGTHKVVYPHGRNLF